MADFEDVDIDENFLDWLGRREARQC
jgi:hypothetical protein